MVTRFRLWSKQMEKVKNIIRTVFVGVAVCFAICVVIGAVLL